jgi:hypothetical protein
LIICGLAMLARSAGKRPVPAERALAITWIAALLVIAGFVLLYPAACSSP